MGKEKVIFAETEEIGKDKALALTVEKFYNLGSKIIILTSSKERGENLDEYLWTFKQQSFIPHIYSEEIVNEEPVVITVAEKNLNGASVLILDTPSSHDFMREFDWVIDFVDRSSDQALRESRARFKEYKEAGFDVEYKKDLLL